MAVEKEDLWIISEMFYPVEGSTGYIMTTIAEGLTEQFNVKVLTGPASYDVQTESTNKTLEIYKDIEINRIGNVPFGKNNILSRLLRLVVISTILGFRVLTRVKRDSKIFMVTNPAPLLILMSLLVKLKNIRLYLLIHDVYPDNMLSASLLKNKGFFYKGLKALFSYCYNKTERILVLGRDMQDIIKDRTTTKVQIVENWANLDLIFPKNKDYSNTALPDLKDKVVFLYAGNIGRVQGIDFLCEIMNEFKDDDRVAFVFAGGGAKEEDLKNYIKEKSISNVYLTGSYLRNEQEKILNFGDIGIVSLSEGMYGLGVPCKTYNYLAAGKPILFLGHKQSEIALLVKEKAIGWISETGQIADAVKVINSILEESDRLDLYSPKTRSLVETNYSQEAIINKFRRILTS